MNSFTLKLVRALLHQVIDEVNRQITRVQNEVIQEAQNLVREVVNGAWKGPDADRFIAEVNNEILPGLDVTNRGHRKTIEGCEHAAQTITEADNRAAQLVADLNSTFARIY